MYLNEKSWSAQQDNPYVVDYKIRNFLDTYSAVKRQYPQKEVYVPEDEILFSRPVYETIILR